MSISTKDTVTELLATAASDEQPVVNQLLPVVYDELREMAHHQLARERNNHTLGTTALVHEAYLKLVDQTRISEKGRAYFFGAAARAMRQILVDYARRRNRQKRGGGQTPDTLVEQHLAVDEFAAELLDLDESLDRLAALNERHARVIEYRFFGGMTIDETAQALDVSASTVKNDWALARAWLYRTLHSESDA